MQLKPGHHSPRRDADQLRDIKAAIKAGKPFSQFWTDTAMHWPCHVHLPAPTTGYRRPGGNPLYKAVEWKRLQNLYTYYAYRFRGDARYVNATQAQPYSYNDVETVTAARCTAAGQPFAQFWSMYGRHWNKPMYRLRNWYRGLQKKWRDIIALSPNMTEAERGAAVLALGAPAATRRRDTVEMVSIRAMPRSTTPIRRYLRKQLGISSELADLVIAGQRFLPCVRRTPAEVVSALRELGADAVVVKQ